MPLLIPQRNSQSSGLGRANAGFSTTASEKITTRNSQQRRRITARNSQQQQEISLLRACIDVSFDPEGLLSTAQYATNLLCDLGNFRVDHSGCGPSGKKGRRAS